MRYKGFLFVALLCTGFYAKMAVSGEEVAISNDGSDPVVQIDQKYEAKEQEINNLNKQFRPDLELLQQLDHERDSLRKQKLELTQNKIQAKQNLDQSYKMLIDNPNHDISGAQSDYKSIWNKEKGVDQSIQTNSKLLNQQELLLNEFNQRKNSLTEELKAIRASRDAARIARLNQELNVTDVIEVNAKFSCNQDMTLRQCAEQSRLAALKGGVSQFKNLVLSRVTEKDLINSNGNSSKLELNIRVIHDRVIESGFASNNTFNTKLEAQLQAQPSTFSACLLLGIDEYYCNNTQANSTSNNDKHIIKTDAHPSKKMAKLTIRSKQSNDVVIIDDVVYGSTPVDIMLPLNQNIKIVVRKPGFTPFLKSIKLTKNQTLWAELAKTPINDTLKTASTQEANTESKTIKNSGVTADSIKVTNPQK